MSNKSNKRSPFSTVAMLLGYGVVGWASGHTINAALEPSVTSTTGEPYGALGYPPGVTGGTSR